MSRSDRSSLSFGLVRARGCAFMVAALVAAGCSAKLDGRMVGLGSSPPPGPRPASQGGMGGGTAEAPSGDGASGAASRAETVSRDDATASGVGGSRDPAPAAGACQAQRWADAWPYLDRPADPWLAVVDGRPARTTLPRDRRGHRPPTGRAACDAAHDHCLRDCTWIVTQSRGGGQDHRASAFHVGPDGGFVAAPDGTSVNPQPGFVAYRSVPATRANLRVGALAIAVPAPARDAGPTPLDAIWHVGTVASIDWSAGTLRLEGQREPYFVSAARIAVLRYQDGGRVEALAGDARAPSLADLDAPSATAATSDPWAAVDRDGQPIAIDDTAPLATFDDTCGPRADHCLRPWVWFVESNQRLVPSRWTGKRFVLADDARTAVEPAGIAYRTRPASASLAPGARVVVYGDGGLPTSQRTAHLVRGWHLADVEHVDRARGTFTVAGSDHAIPIANARELVLYWLAGDRATRVD